jgi:hypothetical protein
VLTGGGWDPGLKLLIQTESNTSTTNGAFIVGFPRGAGIPAFLSGDALSFCPTGKKGARKACVREANSKKDRYEHLDTQSNFTITERFVHNKEH